jgi:hypothetical protein
MSGLLVYGEVHVQGVIHPINGVLDGYHPELNVLDAFQ